VVDQVLFRFQLRGSFLEIFAIKVESCQKAHQIFDVFRPAKFSCGHSLQNLYSRYHAYLAVRRLVKFPSVIATSPKVIDTFVMNFKLIFECSRLNFFGGPPSQFEVCARQPWSTSSVCKNLRSQLPSRAKI